MSRIELVRGCARDSGKKRGGFRNRAKETKKERERDREARYS